MVKTIVAAVRNFWRTGGWEFASGLMWCDEAGEAVERHSSTTQWYDWMVSFDHGMMW